MATKNRNTKAPVAVAYLTDREKLAIVSLRGNEVESSLLATAFGISTRSVAALVANATRGAGIYATASR